jgi:phosphotransferase system HPr-like phosphotransfer protein
MGSKSRYVVEIEWYKAEDGVHSRPSSILWQPLAGTKAEVAILHEGAERVLDTNQSYYEIMNALGGVVVGDVFSIALSNPYAEDTWSALADVVREKSDLLGGRLVRAYIEE